jgi:GT2 family glycosyltransferase
MELSVIIVSYKVQPYLEQCLYSLLRAVNRLDAEIFVVDNASEDGTAAWLESSFPQIQTIPLSENIGFSRANNLVLPRVSGKYVLFLNPDTLQEEDGLEKCLAFMEAHPEAGALGVRMMNGFGAYLHESKRGMPGALASLFKFAGLTARFPKHRFLARYYMGHLHARQTHTVPVLAGAYMLVRASVLQEVGGFDERFFMFGEDIDLSRRIGQAGWKNYYYADVLLIHFKGQSTDKGSDAYAKYFFGAMSLYVRKYYGGALSFLYRQILQAGIFLQKTRTALLPPRPRHWTPETVRFNYLIVGSENDVRTFLSQYDTTGVFFFTLNPERSTIRNIHPYLGLDGGSPVLFCLGELTYAEVLRWMDVTGWEAPCFFHDVRSLGIVGPYKGWPIPFKRK